MPENSPKKTFLFPIVVILGLVLVLVVMIFPAFRYWIKTENRSETSIIMKSILITSHKIPGSFEKSPFAFAYYNAILELEFRSVAALNGKNASIKVAKEIRFLVNEDLPPGTAVLSGKIESYQVNRRDSFHYDLMEAKIFVSSNKEAEKWINGLVKTRQKYGKIFGPGPIFKEPQKVSPPKTE